MSHFNYSHAIVCRISNNSTAFENVRLAQKQHENYVQLLRDLKIDVIELAPDDNLPQTVFVENGAVICNGSALLTKPVGCSRRAELESVRLVLKKDLCLPIVEISDPNARLDGSDVLFTGREFFVGISNWTNEAGAKAVAAAFPEFPCTLIEVGGEKHLKTYISMASDNVLCVCSSDNESRKILKQMEREAAFRYQLLTVADRIAANVLYANDTLVHRALDENSASHKVF